MDVSVPYLNPVKEDLIKSNDWGRLLGDKSKPGTSSVGNNFAAEIGSALALLSISSSTLEGHKASVVEKEKEVGEVLAQKEKHVVVKLAPNSESRVDEELRNSKTLCSSEKHVNDEKKIPDIAVDEKHPTSPKLVSAMKGSHEKRGVRAEKLRVSWAADVYDPPVTSLSHAVTDNQHGSSSSKKSYRNKNKHKAKSSRKSNNEKKKGSKSSRNSSKVCSY